MPSRTTQPTRICGPGEVRIGSKYSGLSSAMTTPRMIGRRRQNVGRDTPVRCEGLDLAVQCLSLADRRGKTRQHLGEFTANLPVDVQRRHDPTEGLALHPIGHRARANRPDRGRLSTRSSLVRTRCEQVLLPGWQRHRVLGVVRSPIEVRWSSVAGRRGVAVRRLRAVAQPEWSDSCERRVAQRPIPAIREVGRPAPT